LFCLVDRIRVKEDRIEGQRFKRVGDLFPETEKRSDSAVGSGVLLREGQQ